MGNELSDYRDALDFLFARTTGKNKLGLERVEALLKYLGDPHKQLRVFHVAGTNGKGSVCATLEALMRWRGLRVGKYTSPHLVDFRERFLVNGTPIEAQFVVDFIRDHVKAVEDLGATFFEATTAMAFEWFVRQQVEVLILETGLGGRLDATNVVQPLVAGVSSIGIDHVEYLGNSREEIAREKAGIFKRDAAAVVGEPDVEIGALLRDAALAVGARPVVEVWRENPPVEVAVAAEGTRFALRHDGGPVSLVTPLLGEHQASNAALAIAMTEAAGRPFALTAVELQAALRTVRLPGRFHRVGRMIFDVAHNADGATVLTRTLRALGVERPLVGIVCILADKDWQSILDALSPALDELVLVNAPTAPSSRMWRIEEAYAYARSRGWLARMELDFDQAIDASSRVSGTVLITGSFHTVGDAMDRLQVDPLAR